MSVMGVLHQSLGPLTNHQVSRDRRLAGHLFHEERAIEPSAAVSKITRPSACIHRPCDDEKYPSCTSPLANFSSTGLLSVVEHVWNGLQSLSIVVIDKSVWLGMRLVSIGQRFALSANSDASL